MRALSNPRNRHTDLFNPKTGLVELDRAWAVQKARRLAPVYGVVLYCTGLLFALSTAAPSTWIEYVAVGFFLAAHFLVFCGSLVLSFATIFSSFALRWLLQRPDARAMISDLLEHPLKKRSTPRILPQQDAPLIHAMLQHCQTEQALCIQMETLAFLTDNPFDTAHFWRREYDKLVLLQARAPKSARLTCFSRLLMRCVGELDMRETVYLFFPTEGNPLGSAHEQLQFAVSVEAHKQRLAATATSSNPKKV